MFDWLDRTPLAAVESPRSDGGACGSHFGNIHVISLKSGDDTLEYLGNRTWESQWKLVLDRDDYGSDKSGSDGSGSYCNRVSHYKSYRWHRFGFNCGLSGSGLLSVGQQFIDGSVLLEYSQTECNSPGLPPATCGVLQPTSAMTAPELLAAFKAYGQSNYVAPGGGASADGAQGTGNAWQGGLKYYPREATATCSPLLIKSGTTQATLNDPNPVSQREGNIHSVAP